MDLRTALRRQYRGIVDHGGAKLERDVVSTARHIAEGFSSASVVETGILAPGVRPEGLCYEIVCDEVLGYEVPCYGILGL